jgi:hypothetical protein
MRLPLERPTVTALVGPSTLRRGGPSRLRRVGPSGLTMVGRLVDSSAVALSISDVVTYQRLTTITK